MEAIKVILDGQEVGVETESLSVPLTDDKAVYSLHLRNLPAQYCYYELLRCKAAKNEEELKCAYNLWLLAHKQKVDTKRFLTEKAKEDAAITQNMQEYNERQKAIIDAVYTHAQLRAVVRALEMKQAIMMSLLKTKSTTPQKENDEIGR